MNRTDLFTQHRPLLFSIAYRMLGSVMEAEDMVQESFLRWQRAAEGEVHAPKAFLVTIVSRLCLDRLRSAQAQREEYIGPWLPEPLPTAPNTELAESLGMAFLVLLESLTPTERAAFLLREVFEYDYPDIAAIVGKSEANCRQMVRRARQHIAARRPRFDATPAQAERLIGQFAQTCATGDLPGLVSLLADDITLWSDGGGKVAAARKPIHGAEAVARFLVSVLRKAPPGLVYRPTALNGQPAVIGYLDRQPAITVLFTIADDTIQALHFVLNPDKLGSLPPLAEAPP